MNLRLTREHGKTQGDFTVNGRGYGSGGPASHTRTFPDLVTPPPPGRQRNVTAQKLEKSDTDENLWSET